MIAIQSVICEKKQHCKTREYKGKLASPVYFQALITVLEVKLSKHLAETCQNLFPFSTWSTLETKNIVSSGKKTANCTSLHGTKTSFREKLFCIATFKKQSNKRPEALRSINKHRQERLMSKAVKMDLFNLIVAYGGKKAQPYPCSPHLPSGCANTCQKAGENLMKDSNWWKRKKLQLVRCFLYRKPTDSTAVFNETESSTRSNYQSITPFDRDHVSEKSSVSSKENGRHFNGVGSLCQNFRTPPWKEEI